MPGSKPGERRGGRKKGTRNKISRDLKEAILEAAQRAGGKDGMIGYLELQAATNPGPFLSLLGKVLPLQITGKDGGPIESKDVSARDALLDRIAGISARKREDAAPPKPN